VLADHFLEAERRGKTGHGLSRVEWLATLPDLDPDAEPKVEIAEGGYERWDGGGALGYLVLAKIIEAQLADPPERARVIVAARCFPTGMLGYWVRKLAEGGFVAALTATSPARLGSPAGGPKLAGTNPLAIAIPSSDGRPVVTDVSMGAVTYGDVLTGAATPEELVPFGGEQAHKGFALALGLQLIVDSLTGAEGYGAVLLLARPEGDPVPALRELAAGVRLPGDQ
jgi:LDH2 family malate/lactate/ureidoglycolate dehydrogenase